MNIIQALNLCDLTTTELEDMKMSSFNTIFDASRKICEDEHITAPSLPLKDSSSYKIQRKKKGIAEKCDDSCEKYKNVFENIVDIYIEEIANRFVRDELT